MVPLLTDFGAFIFVEEREHVMERPEISFLKAVWRRWRDNDAQLLAASISYYAILALLPLLLLITAAIRSVMGEGARTRLTESLASLMGGSAARIADQILDLARVQTTGVTTIIGVVLIAYFASNVFRQLKLVVNRMWGVQRRGLDQMIYDRLLSIIMVVVAIIAIIASFLVSALTGVISDITFIPSGLMHFANGIGLFLINASLFGAMFKYLPETRVTWKDVASGAVFTALLFAIGNSLIGILIWKSAVASLYGVLGALIIAMLWSYYAAQILLFGVAWTVIYAERFGSRA